MPSKDDDERAQFRADRARVARQRNRDTRAWRLYWHFDRNGITLAEVRAFDDADWARAGAAAGLSSRNPSPSEATRALVVGFMTPRPSRK